MLLGDIKTPVSSTTSTVAAGSWMNSPISSTRAPSSGPCGCMGFGCQDLTKSLPPGSPTRARQNITYAADPISLGIYKGAPPRDLYVTGSGLATVPAGCGPPTGDAVLVVDQETRDKYLGKSSSSKYLPLVVIGGLILFFALK